MYRKRMWAGWGDMDFNSHMRNTAYLDKSGDARMLYFAENGFPMSEFMRLKIGPVILRDEIEYFREVRLLEEFDVDLSLAGLSDDNSRFVLRNEFFRVDGKAVAKVSSVGGWLDLTTRKLVAPPAELLEVISRAPRAPDFNLLATALPGAL